MFAENTKCQITAIPSPMFEHLKGAQCKAMNVEGARGTGTQRFDIAEKGCIFGNGDSGFKVEPV